MPMPSKPEAGVRANSSESASRVMWSKSPRSVLRRRSVCSRQVASEVKSEGMWTCPRQSVVDSGRMQRKPLNTGPSLPSALRSISSVS
jgi:hypothetical protein